MSKQVTQLAEELVQPILDENDLQLVDIEYVKEGKNWFLRIYIDKQGGIDILECSTVSEKLSEILDELDPIKEAYFLEVSSPGAERPLKTKEAVASHVGENVFVTLYEQIDGEKSYEGILKSFENDTVHLTYKDKTRIKEIEIPYGKIAKIRLAVTF